VKSLQTLYNGYKTLGEDGMTWKNVSQKIIRNKIFWVLVFLLVAGLVYLDYCTLGIKNPVLIDAEGHQTKIGLPYTKEMPETEYVISGKIFYNSLLCVNTVHIIPDDILLSIRVNHEEVSLKEVNPGSLSDYFEGFHFNLGRYLKDGTNDIEIRIKNNGGPSSLIFENSRRDIKTQILGWLLMIAMMGMLYYILSCFISNRAVVLIILGGFLIRILYFLVTPYGTRTHDVEGHIPYIEYILQHWSIPPRDSGWESYQPPLYYFAAALVYKAGELLGVQSTYILYRLVQFFSLLLSMGFLFFALSVIRNIAAHLPGFHPAGATAESGKRQMKTDWFIALVLGLITFWPSNIMHSVRIGNDVMFYFLYALGLMFLVKWYYDNTDKNLFLSFIFTTLCFITKANALILYGIIGIIYIWKFFMDKNRKIKPYVIRTAILLVIFAVGFWITFGAAVAEKIKGTSEHFMVPNIGNVGGQEVGNHLKNYVWFDLPEFINAPYTDPWGDKGGRQYFWNYLFKTGLVGEFQFDTPFHRMLSIILSDLFLVMLVFTLGGMVLFLRKEWKKHLILLLNLILLIIAAILFRISIPASCSNDFRYILPVLISFCFFYGYTMSYCRRKGWKELEFAGYLLAILFVITSGLFIVGLQF
jgi:hypothetical protein